MSELQDQTDTQVQAEKLAQPSLRINECYAQITLRRPAQHNRIDPQDIEVIMAHLDSIERHPDVRAIVLSGSGSKTFCSGYTLGAIQSQLNNSFEDMLDRLETLPLPTICALNGSVYGGGTDLAICCDFRIGVTDSRMFMPAAKFGLHYYPGGLRRFVTRVGPGFTKKLFLTGQTIDAAEMLRVGYLNELVPPSELPERIQAYISAIITGEAGAISSMKSHIDALAASPWAQAEGREAYQNSRTSPETARRLAQLD
jgi:enoyl-CoA hydratase/carnithine racemase